MFEVVENGTPCSSEGFSYLTSDCWSNNKFETLSEAIAYAKDWANGLLNNVEMTVNTKYYLFGNSIYIEIVY